jgi:hypothetical protein
MSIEIREGIATITIQVGFGRWLGYSCGWLGCSHGWLGCSRSWSRGRITQSTVNEPVRLGDQSRRMGRICSRKLMM